MARDYSWGILPLLKFHVPEVVTDIMECFYHLAGCFPHQIAGIIKGNTKRKGLSMPLFHHLYRTACLHILTNRYNSGPHDICPVDDKRDRP